MGGDGGVAWGRYQAGASVMMAMLKAPAAWFQLSLLYLAPDIRFRCAQQTLSYNQSSNAARDWDDSCSFLDGEGNEQACTRWDYDDSIFTSGVNSKWDLVCDDEFLVTWAQVALMVGVTSGNAIGGFFANRVGRKPVLAVAALLMPLFSAIVAVVPTFPLFLLFRFLLGLSLGGTMVISFVLGAELAVGPHRDAITVLHQLPFSMGQTLFALTGHFLRDWRELQMALSVYCLVFLPYICVIEESPKWLAATGRLKQAERVNEAIRLRNGQAPGLAELRPMTQKHTVEIVKMGGGKVVSRLNPDELSHCELFTSGSRLACLVLSVWTMWYCGGLSFFAMNAYQPALGGDPYVNIGVGGLVGGVPGNILTVYLVRKFGRKRVSLIAHIFVCFFNILIPIYGVGEAPGDWHRRVLGLLTLVAMSIAYPAMFLLCAESVPAVARGVAMPVANLMGRLGNATAPFVGPTAKFHIWTPQTIISVAPAVTIMLMLFMPETHNKPLPQTVRDIEKNDRGPENVVVENQKENGKIYKPVAVNEDS